MLRTLEMAGSQWSYGRKVQQDALGKVNRVKEIRRRGKDGLKINRQQNFVRKKVSRVDSVLHAWWLNITKPHEGSICIQCMKHHSVTRWMDNIHNYTFKEDIWGLSNTLLNFFIPATHGTFHVNTTHNELEVVQPNIACNSA